MRFDLPEGRVCIWDPVRVCVEGCMPGVEAHLTATLVVCGRAISRSEFKMVPDERGFIDFSTTPSVGGSYEGADELGYIWSMANLAEIPSDLWRADQTIELTCCQGDDLACGSYVRATLSDDVTVCPVSIEGVAAELFLPRDSNGTYLITFGGSDGGLAGGHKLATYFSSHGYPCMCISYFGLPGIEPELYAIPLEVIGNTIDKVKQMPGFNGNIGVAGISRGGELALLCSCYYPDIHATLAYVPSSIMWESEDIVRHGPSWSYGGVELPWVLCDWTGYEDVQHTGEEWSCTPVYVKAMDQKEMVEAARMPLERIQGDVLMVSGKDDAIWNSSQLCTMGVDYLHEHGFAHRVVHLDYDGVGHNVFSPGPYSQMRFPPSFRGDCLKRGGDPSRNAHAQVEIREKSLEFLAQAFAR